MEAANLHIRWKSPIGYLGNQALNSGILLALLMVALPAAAWIFSSIMSWFYYLMHCDGDSYLTLGPWYFSVDAKPIFLH